MCTFIEVIGAKYGLIVIFREYLSARLIPRDHFSVTIELLMDHTPDWLDLREESLGGFSFRGEELRVVRQEGWFISVGIYQIKLFLGVTHCRLGADVVSQLRLEG
jgi:hypothetical protein